MFKNFKKQYVLDAIFLLGFLAAGGYLIAVGKEGQEKFSADESTLSQKEKEEKAKWYNVWALGLVIIILGVFGTFWSLFIRIKNGDSSAISSNASSKPDVDAPGASGSYYYY